MKGLNLMTLRERLRGAFYCVDDADVFCQWLLEEFEHEGHTLMMAPASGFYAEPELGKRQVRLAYVLEKEKLELAVDCLRVALEKYPRTVSAKERQKAAGHGARAPDAGTRDRSNERQA